MAGHSRIVLIGNVGQAPELRTTSSGKTVCDFSLAVNERGSDGKDQVAWFKCTAWQKTAEVCAKYLDKGKQVFVEGRPSVETWDDKKTGETRARIKVTADRVVFLGGGKSEQSSERRQSEPRSDADDGPPPYDDDIPF